MTKKQFPNKPKATAPATPADPDALRKLKISLGIIIAVFAFILYAQSISFNYTYDDIAVTSQNKIIRMGISGIPTILKTDYWYGYKDNLRGPVYRPVSLVMFALEWQLFPDNPHVYHFINILLY